MAKRIIVVAFLIFAFSVTLAFGENHTTAERGKAHFNNAAFAGGKRSCNSCHPGGSGLEEAGSKETFNIMGGEQGSLEEAVNICIVNANRGDAIDVDSTKMQEMVSYIKSLGQ